MKNRLRSNIKMNPSQIARKNYLFCTVNCTVQLSRGRNVFITNKMCFPLSFEKIFRSVGQKI